MPAQRVDPRTVYGVVGPQPTAQEPKEEKKARRRGEEGKGSTLGAATVALAAAVVGWGLAAYYTGIPGPIDTTKAAARGVGSLFSRKDAEEAARKGVGLPRPLDITGEIKTSGGNLVPAQKRFLMAVTIQGEEGIYAITNPKTEKNLWAAANKNGGKLPDETMDLEGVQTLRRVYRLDGTPYTSSDFKDGELQTDKLGGVILGESVTLKAEELGVKFTEPTVLLTPVKTYKLKTQEEVARAERDAQQRLVLERIERDRQVKAAEYRAYDKNRIQTREWRYWQKYQRYR